MSLYDDAKFILLAEGATAKDGKIFNIKPTKGDSYVTVNADLSTSGTISDNSYSLGWYYGSTQEGTSSIANNQITLSNESDETLAEVRLSNGTNGNTIDLGVQYRLEYTVVENNGCDDFATYNASDNPVFTQAPNTVGTHVVFIKNSTNRLVILRNSRADSSIVLKDIKVERDIDFSFSRGSDLTATRVNKEGYVEKGRENLIKHSNNLSNSGWANTNFEYTFAVAVGGQKGYDGNNNAWLIEKILTNNSYIGGPYFGYNGVFTWSIYAKNEGSGEKGIMMYTQYVQAHFNLVNGTIIKSSVDGYSSAIDARIEPVGDGWYRCSVTGVGEIIDYLNDPDDPSDAESRPRFKVINLDGQDEGSGEYNTTGKILVQDMQFERGLNVTEYIESGASTGKAGVLEDEPRFDYSRGDKPGILLEIQRRNHVTHSEHYDHSDWDAQSRSSNLVWKTNEVNPSGYKGCFEYESTAANNQLGIVGATAPADGDNITNSIYVKRVSGTGQVQLRDCNNAATNFDLSVADGWKRLVVTAAADEDVNNGLGARHYFNLATVGDKVLVWGSQYEPGVFATSYVPTYGTSATRTVDVPAELQHGITMGTSCAVFFEGRHVAKDHGQVSFFQLKTDDPNRFLIYGSPAGETTFPLHVQHRVNNVSVTSSSKTINIEETFKIMVVMNETTMDMYIDGELHESKTITAQDHFEKMNLIRTGATNQSGHECYQVILFDDLVSVSDAEVLTGATHYDSFVDMSKTLSYTKYE